MPRRSPITKFTTLCFRKLPKTYAGLVALHLPRPIHDEAAYGRAVAVIHALAGHKLNDDQDDYLAVMAMLVEDYEKEHVPEPKPVQGIETLKFLLKENDLTADDLGKIIGVNRSMADRILKGTHNLSSDHVKKLAARGWRLVAYTVPPAKTGPELLTVDPQVERKRARALRKPYGSCPDFPKLDWSGSAALTRGKLNRSLTAAERTAVLAGSQGT